MTKTNNIEPKLKSLTVTVNTDFLFKEGQFKNYQKCPVDQEYFRVQFNNEMQPVLLSCNQTDCDLDIFIDSDTQEIDGRIEIYNHEHELDVQMDLLEFHLLGLISEEDIAYAIKWAQVECKKYRLMKAILEA